MKTFYSKSVLLAALCLLALVSCQKKPMMPNYGGEIQFTNLTADNTALASGATTKITATVQNECPEISYNWSTSTGTIIGKTSQVTFSAPSSSAQVAVTCTVNHPGKQSKTKSVNITVQ